MGLTYDEINDSETTVDEYELVEGEKVPGGLTQYLTKKEARFRQLVNHQPMSIWSKCWEEGITPWDAGDVLPIVAYLVKEGQLPNGTALVPGCGSGYDAIALASPSRHVIGLDISELALNRAKQIAGSSSNGEWVEFLNADFYTYQPPKPFDLIFDYTFFCAMEPLMRLEWGKKMAELLAPDGELITLMFPLDNHVGGPPYAVSVEAYEKVLHPFGMKAYYMQENELSIEPRKGREILARWKRMTS